MKHLKTYKIFEGYPPNDFQIESEMLYKKLLPDIEDILLELKDDGLEVDVNKYIDDVFFEIQVEIENIESNEQKQLSEDSIFRLQVFLDENNIHLAKIDMMQWESGYRHDFEIYDISELLDLKNTAGLINISISFRKDLY